MRTNTHKVVYDDEEASKRMKPPPANAARSDGGSGKHPGEASSSQRPEKSSRTSEGLSSSPTFAGNIGQVKLHSGIEMWVDDEEPFETNYVKDIEDIAFALIMLMILNKAIFLLKQTDHLIFLRMNF